MATGTTKALTPAAQRRAVATAGKDKQEKLINILKDDYNFDIIEKIHAHMGQIERAKKIRPLEKHRLLQKYYLELLSYCLPKMKLIEDNTAKTGDKIQFNINLGDPTPPVAVKASGKKKKGTGINITLPTVKTASGSFAVDSTFDEDDED